MSTEVASLLVTAEGQTGDAERALDRLGIKYDQTVERMRGAQGRFVGFADANKLAATEIKRHGEAIDVLRGRLQAGAADLQRFGAYLTAGVTVPIIGAGAAAVKFAGDLQSSVSLIRTIRPDFDTSKVFNSLSVLQTQIPQTSAQLGEAAYNIVSSLDDIGEAATLNLTEKFGKGATAARVDALSFGTAILGVLNAYKLKVTDVDHVQDLFFQTVNRGIITGAELSSELASVSKAAQNAGVDLDTLMALVVGATKEAGPAAENMTQLSQVLNQFTAKEAQKGLKELGIATHDAKGNFLPMVGILEQVKAKYDQLSEVDKSKLVQGLFPDIRSQKGFATLLRELDSVKAALNDPSTAGAADRAFETVSKTFNFQFAIFLNTVRHAFETIGAEILPVIIPIVKFLGDAMRSAVQTAINAWKALPAGAKAAVVALLGFAASLGPVLTVLGTIAVAVLGVAGSVGSVVTAVAAAGGLAALSEILIPVGAVIAGIVVLLAELAAEATLVAVVIYKAWTTNFLGIRDLTLQAWGAIKSFVLSVWQEMQGAYQLIMPELVTLTHNVLAGITALWNVFGKDIVAVVRYIWNTVAPTFKAGLVIISSLVAGVLALINGNWEKAWDMAVRIVETFIVRLSINIARIYFAIAMIPVYILSKIGDFIVAGGKLAWGLITGLVDEIRNSAPRVAMACVELAVILTNPTILAAYAAAGIAQARARNQAFDAALKNGPGERYADEGEYVTPGSQTPKDDAGPASTKGSGGLPKRFGGGGGKGGGGGESAARKAYRLQIQEAETALSAIERINQRQLTDQEYFYSEGISLLTDYVAARKDASDKLFAAEQTRDAAEMAALRASGLKGKEREVEEGKLNEKALADKQKHEVALTEIERYAAAQRKEIDKVAWDGKLALLEETASGFEAVYQRLAEQGVMSFKSATSQIDNAHMEILIAQKVGIERELEKVTKGTKQWAELSSSLDAALQRIENFRAQMHANSEDADRKDLDSKRNYESQLRGVYQGITDLEMQSQRDRLQILEQMGLKKEIVWRREMELSLAQAETDKQRRIEDLERQRDYIAQTEKNEERRLELTKSINDQIAAEERRSTQVRENIVADFYEKQRQKLKDWADKIVGGLKTALDAYKTDGLRGFFTSLAQSFRDVLEQMALDLLKARVLKLLQTVFKIPQVDPNGAGATTNTTGINGGAGAGGFGNIISQLFQGLFHTGKGPANPADAVTQAGSAATKAIKDGWGNSTGAIDKAGTAQAKSLQTVGTQIVGTMLQIGAALAAGSTGMGFFKGLLFAAASGALSALGGSLANKAGGGGGDSGGSGSSGGGNQGRAAMGGFFPARPGGRYIQVAEGGYDEVVLTTDPSQRGRMAGMMAAYMRATGISSGSFAQGGFTSGFTPPSIATAARYGGGGGKRFVQVNLTQEIHTNDPQAFQRTARQNARAARGALSTVLN